MNTINTKSPSFGMKLKGLDNPYFNDVSKTLKKELKQKALHTPNTNYTVEFVTTPEQFVFLKKIVGKNEYMVEYFPKGYTPTDVVRTFLKAILPEYRVMGKIFRNETGRKESEKIYKKLCENHE